MTQLFCSGALPAQEWATITTIWYPEGGNRAMVVLRAVWEEGLYCAEHVGMGVLTRAWFGHNTRTIADIVAQLAGDCRWPPSPLIERVTITHPVLLEGCAERVEDRREGSLRVLSLRLSVEGEVDYRDREPLHDYLREFLATDPYGDRPWPELPRPSRQVRWALATLPLGKAFLSALDGEDSMLCDTHTAVLDLLYVLDHPTAPTT